MELLTTNEIEWVSGGIDSISSACFDAVNLYSQWWYYGILTPETFTSTFTNYCSPDSIIIIDSTGLDVIACISNINAIKVIRICSG